MRFIAAQFDALLADDDGTHDGTALWLRNARHANAMARALAEQLAPFRAAVAVTRPVQVAAFAAPPRLRYIFLRRE